MSKNETRKTVPFRKQFALLPILLLWLLLAAAPSHAVTRAEMLAGLWQGLGYSAASEMRLPPDVPVSHPHAKQIGYAAKYGLISQKDYFMPDAEIDRHSAVEMTLEMIGWRFEAGLYRSLSALPEFGGSGDNLFFLAAEMKPQAPAGLLVDGETPLSDSGKSSLIAWAKSCQKSVKWNRVFSFSGTDLILYRQGTARPGEPNTPGYVNPVTSESCEPLYIAAIAVHPTQVDQHIAFAEPLGRQRIAPTDFAGAYDAIGAVNGGFFSGARPLGTMLLNGNHAGKPLEGRSAVGWNNGSNAFTFGNGNARIGIRSGSTYTEISRFNVAPHENEASFYLYDVAQSAVGSAVDALFLVVRNGTISERRESSENNYWIPEGSGMIVARGTARAALEKLAVGDKLDIVTDWDGTLFQDCTNMIQAGPMLIRNDVFATEAESFKGNVIEKRHPRTIVGTDGKRMIWAVVDGRSALHSRGATLEETKWIAKSMGMTYALNMDGGGSSQLVWRGLLVNLPSDGKERPLPYAILMKPKGTAMARKDVFDSGEFGEFGYTPANNDDDEGAPFMNTYEPPQNTGS